MPQPALKDVFKTLEQSNPGSNIAGYFSGDTFYYEASKSDHVPAAVMLYDNLARDPYIYTNLRTDHWLYTYTKPRGDGSGPGLHFASSAGGNGNLDSKVLVKANKRQIQMLGGEGSTGPLGTGGGLYEAAKTLRNWNGLKTGTEERGLHRALRYYMLAAYAVLGKCAKNDYSEGNYVCALAVDDTGKIISWGVNSGYFHHGEVNMLLNYFTANPGAAKLPPKTIIFSTLTPCRQCTKYLEAACVNMKTDSLVFMGQKDHGDFGQEGENIGSYLGKLTDPVVNREIVQKQRWGKVGEEAVPDFRNPRRIHHYKPIYGNITYNEVNHYSVDTQLDSMMMNKHGKPMSNIAKLVGQRCRLELIDSHDTIARKFIKDRSKVKDAKDQSVKISVLAYLDTWMKNVGQNVSRKEMPS